jgi:hypothetical protein
MKCVPTLAAALVLAASLCSIAQEKKPAPEPFSNDFESETVGELPDKMMEIDGAFTVVELEGGSKVLEMAKEPLAENAVLLGPSVKGAATVSAKVRSFKKRRSYPRFGVGLHGISGFRLRVVPSKKQIELVKNEEPVKSVDFAWVADKWVGMELSLVADGDKWNVEGRVWGEGDERPETATMTFVHEGSPGQGKASLWGTPYSGKVVQFDDVKVVPGR